MKAWVLKLICVYSMKTNITREKCSGCSLCYMVCPKKCIKMEVDSEGFSIPTFYDGCVDCGYCASVCPQNKDNLEKIKFKFPQKALSAVSKDEENFRESSSGGAFSDIAKLFCDENYVIFGAEFDEDLELKISYTFSLDDIAKYRKSKYIQPKISDSYTKALDFLKQGKKVLFTGTPCQVAALKLFLKKDYDNLLTIDFSCHGFGSPESFYKYIQDYEKKYNRKVIYYSFREKMKSLGRNHCQASKIVFDNGKIVRNFLDIWFQGFKKALFKCKACSSCHYVGAKRISDFTLCDFWGIERLDPTLKSMEGVSLVLVNSEKGVSLSEKLNLYSNIKEFDVREAIKGNDPLNFATKENVNRKKFFTLLQNNTVEYSIRKCVNIPTIYDRIVSKIKRILSK